MARRKRKGVIQAEAVMKAAAILGSTFLIVSALKRVTAAELLLPLAGMAVVVAAILYMRHANKRSLTRKLTDAVNANIEPLVRRHAQLVVPDAYGTPQQDRWFKEIDRFVESKVVSNLTQRETVLLRRQSHSWVNHIHNLVSDASALHPAFGAFSAEMSPHEFELFCAEEMKRIGWQAHCTKVGRDQGVDVVAQKDGVRLVLQCKLYSQPVGNKAVQEAFTAKAYEQADFAAVVSNATYTVPAQQLAKSSGVLLLHYSELRNVDGLIGGMNPKWASQLR